MLSRALPRSSRRSLRPRFLMERKGEAPRCRVCWSVISDGHRDAGQSWKSLSSPLRAVSTHGRWGGVRGALYTASRRWSRAPLPSSGHTNPPPPPPQNEVEVTACAWGGGGQVTEDSAALGCLASRPWMLRDSPAPSRWAERARRWQVAHLCPGSPRAGMCPGSRLWPYR